MTVLVVGEALIDIVSGATESERVGGSPCNVAVGLGRLGRPVTFVTDIGTDARGHRIRQHLAAADVTARAAQSGSTSTARAQLNADRSVSYLFDIHWHPMDPGTQPDITLAHTGSIGSWLKPGCEVVSALVERHRGTALITYDPNIRPSLIADERTARARVIEMIAHADVVKASADDIAWWSPGIKPVDVAREWLGRGPTMVIVTLGAEGAVLVKSGLCIGVPAPQVPVVDTIGAGDAFMAALIDGLLRRGAHGIDGRRALAEFDEDRLRNLMADAVAAAAISVQRPGADPPWDGELERATHQEG